MTDIKLIDGEDYEMEHDGCWVGVKGFSIRISKTDEGVCVDIYGRNHEDWDAIASTYAFDSELENHFELKEEEE